MSDLLSQISDGLADVVATAGKSVVRVEARRRMPASGFAWSDGVVVTAHHVVEQDDNISVGLEDGQSVTATLAGRDPATDIAVLRTAGDGLSIPGFSDPDGLRVGHLALALGRPGRTVQATMGVISALGKGWRTPVGGQIDRYLQTDVTMYPGFSGGPLVDASGRVVGLNTSALLRGVTVSVPLPTVRRVVEALLAHGRVSRGYLGVGAQVVRLPDTVKPKLDQGTGLLLVSVEPDSPAQKGGLLLGDTIVSLDGQAVGSLDDLLAALGGDTVGKASLIRVLRGGQLQELSITIGERE